MGSRLLARAKTIQLAACGAWRARCYYCHCYSYDTTTTTISSGGCRRRSSSSSSSSSSTVCRESRTIIWAKQSCPACPTWRGEQDCQKTCNLGLKSKLVGEQVGQNDQDRRKSCLWTILPRFFLNIHVLNSLLNVVVVVVVVVAAAAAAAAVVVVVVVVAAAALLLPSEIGIWLRPRPGSPH